MPGGGFTEQIDASMERASAALSRTDYFEAEHLALRALRTAHNSQDHERMARICMPLQEARRQIRQAACDAGSIAVLDTQTALNDVLVADPSDFQPGCYLVQPPLIGLDGKTVREVILRSRVPVMVITREPRTRAGKWPVVAVGKTTIRAQVDPPADAKPDDKIMAKDRIEGPPPVSWFENASEQLGDQAIRMIDTGLHPWYQVDDLMEVLESVPQHEKLHQALMATCRAAFEAGEPTEPRPRSRDDDLRSF
ncbi:MAG: hypothetical protein AAGB51_02325 [Planctomycetota bacterium]